MIWAVEGEDCAISSSPLSSTGAFRFIRFEQVLGVLDGQVRSWNTIVNTPSTSYLLISQRVWLALCSCHVHGYGSLYIFVSGPALVITSFR